MSSAYFCRCLCVYVYVRVCVCVCVCVLTKVVNRGHPWVLLQTTGHTFHTGHMPVCSELLKQCKMRSLWRFIATWSNTTWSNLQMG